MVLPLSLRAAWLRESLPVELVLRESEPPARFFLGAAVEAPALRSLWLLLQFDSSSDCRCFALLKSWLRGGLPESLFASAPAVEVPALKSLWASLQFDCASSLFSLLPAWLLASAPPTLGADTPAVAPVCASQLLPASLRASSRPGLEGADIPAVAPVCASQPRTLR